MIVAGAANALAVILILWCTINSNSSVQAKTLSKFPNNFKFGTASSAYQIEGAWNTDGKGENIWDHMTHVAPETVFERHNGDIAADSYHKYKEDVQMLKNVEVDFYRFSIAWSRVLPNGTTSVINEAGLQYYDNLINELLVNGIEPVVTIFHWDLPLPIQKLGGLNSPSFVEHFEKYVEVLFDRFHDRVKTWITFNEPIVSCNYFFMQPSPPFLADDNWLVNNYRCAHNVLLANAKAYDLYKRKYAKIGDQVGIALNGRLAMPKDMKNSSDVAAADRYMQFSFGIFTHPIFSKTGDYPQLMRDIVDAKSKIEGRTESRLPVMTDAEIQLIKGKSDFLGINYYSSRFVSSPTDDCQICAKYDFEAEETIAENWPKGKSSFLYSVPEGLRGLLNWIRLEYNNPEVMITENGWSDDGELNDVGRITYLQTHLNATLNALNDGCNVTAHTTWSIMDNFEWLSGYCEHFGLYHVDFNSTERTRTPKASAGFLREVIRSRSIP